MSVFQLIFFQCLDTLGGCKVIWHIRKPLINSRGTLLENQTKPRVTPEGEAWLNKKVVIIN